LKLSVQIKPLSVRETKAAAAPAAMCLVTLYGADRPGIVYRVAETLARHRVNITDVTTHRTDASRAAKAGYILYLEGELPRAGFAKLEADLQTLGRQLGVTVSLKPQEPTAL
jgi:glycine cleavage system transcriptional repressor